MPGLEHTEFVDRLADLLAEYAVARGFAEMDAVEWGARKARAMAELLEPDVKLLVELRDELDWLNDQVERVSEVA